MLFRVPPRPPSRPGTDGGRLPSAFRRLLAANALSQLGIGFHLAAFPLLVSTLTSDPTVVAATALASVVPGLLLAVPVGTWVDRSHRGRLMVGSDLVAAAVLAALTLLVVLGRVELWMIFVAAGILGGAELVFGVSTFALLPTIVPPAELTRANSLLSIAGETGSGIVGPALGGMTYGLVPFLPSAVNAATYLGSSATIASFVRHRDTRAAPEGDGPTGPDGSTDHDGPSDSEHVPNGAGRRRHEMLAGVGYLARTAAPRTLLLLSASAALFGWMPEATLVLFARERLGLTSGEFGLLLGVTTVGAVLGGLLAGPITARQGAVRVLCLTYGTYGLLLIPVGLTTNPVVVGVMFFLQGLPLIACDATIRSLLQLVVPPRLLGRVAAVNRVVHSLMTPIGLAAGGFLAGWLGYSAVWIIAGGGYLACCAINLPAVLRLRRFSPT